MPCCVVEVYPRYGKVEVEGNFGFCFDSNTRVGQSYVNRGPTSFIDDSIDVIDCIAKVDL